MVNHADEATASAAGRQTPARSVLLRRRSSARLLAAVAILVGAAIAGWWLAAGRYKAGGAAGAAGSGPRVVLIGLDGASWKVLDPLLAAGVLPHLDGLRRRGV